MRHRALAIGLFLLALPATAKTFAVPLNDYTRLGQRFTVTRSLATVAASVPSWSDNEGLVTLTLWDSPARQTKLAEHRPESIRDNEYVEVRPKEALPPGSYYWEISERTGETRIGLWCDELPADSDDCAYLDGKPDKRKRFKYRVTAALLPRQELDALVAALGSGKFEQQDEACRLLAVYGTAETVPALLKLLPDPKLSHRARYAMENLPDPAVDVAFREALGQLKGLSLIGVINSVGVRRDGGAVGKLTELLGSPDLAVASAAAVALGAIGNPAAARALEAALPGSEALRPALYEGCLNCAARIPSAALFNRLRVPPAPRPIQLGATRGYLVTRGAEGLPELTKLLRSDDPELLKTALYVVQHELPEPGVTLALAAELRSLPAATQVRLIEALAVRADPGALPALGSALGREDRSVRLAAANALGSFGEPAAPDLLRLLDDPDEQLRQAAQRGLLELPREVTVKVAGELLSNPQAAKRSCAIALIQGRYLPEFADRLAKALTDQDPGLRLAAAKALVELGAAPQIPALCQALAAAEADQAKAVEQALAAVAGRVGDPEAAATQVLVGFAQANPTTRAALLRVLGTVGGGQALQAVLQTVAGPAGDVRSVALDVLCGWRTADAAPALLKLAQTAADEGEKLKCLRGLLRLAGRPELAADLRLQLCQQANALLQRDEERKMLLGALGSLGSVGALELAVLYLDQAGTREEACAAVLGIADSLVKGPDKAILAAPLQKVVAVTTNDEFKQRAQKLLDQAR